MNPFSIFYTEIIYRPLLNALAGLYILLPYPDLGLAIVVMTVAVRLLLHPAIAQAVRSQSAMARLAPRLKEIQARHKDSREEQARRTMALYREYGIHPLSGCLPLVIQLPVLIGLYQVFLTGIALTDRSLLYPFLVARVAGFDPVAFGLVDLARRSIPLALAAGITQFFQGRTMPAPDPGSAGDMARAMHWQTRYVFPAIVALISWSLPSALALYWTVFNIFAIVQQRWIERFSHVHVQPMRSPEPNP